MIIEIKSPYFINRFLIIFGLLKAIIRVFWHGDVEIDCAAMHEVKKNNSKIAGFGG